jgi:hypothetical protein
MANSGRDWAVTLECDDLSPLSKAAKRPRAAISRRTPKGGSAHKTEHWTLNLGFWTFPRFWPLLGSAFGSGLVHTGLRQESSQVGIVKPFLLTANRLVRLARPGRLCYTASDRRRNGSFLVCSRSPTAAGPCAKAARCRPPLVAAEKSQGQIVVSNRWQD